MSETSPAPAPNRPRPFLLWILGIAVVGFLVYWMWPEASKPLAPSNTVRQQRKAGPQGVAGSTGPLDVRLEALKQPPPTPESEGRNPFRFYVKPPPPPPPRPVVTQTPQQINPGPPPPPPGPPPPPPINVKFLGWVEVKGKKYAILSDGRGMPVWAAEGENAFGQYRVVKIGVESVTMEYLNGTGRQTIPMRG